MVIEMVQLIGLALIALTALIVLFNLIKGLIRGFKKTIGSLIAIAASAVIAFIVTVVICKPSSELTVYLVSQLNALLGEEMSQMLFGIEAVGDVLNYYVAMIIAPLVFLVLYMVLSIILAIVAGIVVRIMIRKKKPKGVVHRLGGLGVGLVCGLLVSTILLMPVTGLLGVAAEVGKQADPDMLGDEEIADLLESLGEDQTLAIYHTASGWLFDALSTTYFEGDKTSLKSELVAILGIVSNFSALSGEEFGEAEINSLNAAVDGLDDSPLIKHAAAGLISEMAGSWAAGESFLGIEKIDAGELLNPVIDSVIGVLATTDKNYVIADLHTLTGILGIFVKHDLMGSAESGDMLTTLGKGGVIAELMREANKNERMSVISDSIAQLSVRALGSTIGIPKDHAERYNKLMDESAQILNDSAYMSYDERYAYVDEQLIKVLDKYGVDVEDEAVLSITESILADLGSAGQLDGSDISEFFIIYEVGFESTTSVSSGNGFDLLNDNKPVVVVNGDGTISVGEKVFRNYHANDYRNSSAYTMGHDHVNFGDAATLYSVESMHSSLITMSDIMDGIKKFSDCEDPDAEIEKISDMLSEAVDLFGSDFSSMNKSDLFNNMGSLLDKMSETEIFGSQVTSGVLTAVVQSESVRDELGLTNKDATNFADKLNSTSATENGSYGSSTQAVSNTIEVVDKINDSNTTKEERRESTEKLISNMTPDNAELLGTMTSPSMMVKYGSSEESADVVADSVSTLLTNMANFQDKATSETTYDTEADAVNTLLTLAMDSASSESNTLFATESNDGGKTGTTAMEYVELFVNSDVVSETLITTVYDEGNDDNPFNVKPTEEDKVEFSNAVSEYYEANKEGLSEEEHDILVKKLNAVAIITNMELPFEVE